MFKKIIDEDSFISILEVRHAEELFEVIDKVGINLSESIYHNVLVTRMDGEFVYVFDSYIMNSSIIESDIEFFDNETYQFNRKVTIKRLNDFEDKFYSMGNQVKRECVLISKI